MEKIDIQADENTPKEKIKKFAPIILEEIKKANKILLCLHPRPDFDSLGSNLALYHTLKILGKNVRVIKGDSELPKFAKFFPGYTDIKSQSFSETNLAEFDLFIILDIGAKNRISETGEIHFPPSLKTIVIDHHDGRQPFADINLIDSECPATCQLIAELLNEWEIEMTREIAVCLFIGIYYDTGGFVYKNVNKDTFLMIAKLSEIENNLGKNILDIERSRSFKNMAFRALAFNHIENMFSGKAAVIVLSQDDLKKSGFDKIEVSGSIIISDIMKIETVIIGIIMIEEEPSKIKISFRSSDSEKYDVSKIAEIFGGGGHKAASGALINGKLSEVKKMIIETIVKIYPDMAAV